MRVEEWRDIPSVPRYQVSNLGRIKGVRSWQECLILQTDGEGYLFFRAKGKQVYVHRAVCEAWHGPSPEGRPYVLHGILGQQVNTPDNLRWGSQKENMADKIAHRKVLQCG